MFLFKASNNFKPFLSSLHHHHVMKSGCRPIFSRAALAIDKARSVDGVWPDGNGICHLTVASGILPSPVGMHPSLLTRAFAEIPLKMGHLPIARKHHKRCELARNTC